MSSLERAMLSKKGLPPISENPSAPFLPPMSHEAPGHNQSRRPKKDRSPLQWDAFFEHKLSVGVGDDTFCVYTKGDTGPVFYLLHGAGYSALTWACFTEELCSQVECRVVAPDLRGHGDTKTLNEDFSKEQQVDDIVAIHHSLFQNNPPPTFVIGHSMGGALAVHTVSSGRIESVVGLGVIDVVEGTAMESLNIMSIVLANRPNHFKSIQSAIEWCVQSGMTRNLRAARISMPSQIIQTDNGYTWRINLCKTQPFWVGWFEGLSKLFLSCSPPKVLVLAGVDRLDTDLTVGQMQGKFQNTILPRVGHAVQEDSPDHLAETLAHFAIRFRFCTAR